MCRSEPRTAVEGGCALRKLRRLVSEPLRGIEWEACLSYVLEHFSLSSKLSKCYLLNVCISKFDMSGKTLVVRHISCISAKSMEAVAGLVSVVLRLIPMRYTWLKSLQDRVGRHLFTYLNLLSVRQDTVGSIAYDPMESVTAHPAKALIIKLSLQRVTCMEHAG